MEKRRKTTGVRKQGKEGQVTPQAKVGEERRLSIEKAGNELKAVVAWLAKQPFSTKLAAVAAAELLRHQEDFKRDGVYDGKIGDDILSDWYGDVREANLGFHTLDEALKGPDDLVVMQVTAMTMALSHTSV